MPVPAAKTSYLICIAIWYSLFEPMKSSNLLPVSGIENILGCGRYSLSVHKGLQENLMLKLLKLMSSSIHIKVKF